MGYRALLFCPDEKTARTVTQVLSELEFSVEACAEAFAAVKKLMGEHFDAIVVDCDNEQNATLLFKSARNSTSNQTSLAVAVVEGQAGVAKAFRIGANLVLTRPINVEQAKGTLRVARGLLRKGDATRSAAGPVNAGLVATKSESADAISAEPAKLAPGMSTTGTSRQAMSPVASTVSPSPELDLNELNPVEIDTDESAASIASGISQLPPPTFSNAPTSVPAVEAHSSKIQSTSKDSASPLIPGGAAASAPARARSIDPVVVQSPASAPPPPFTFGGVSADSQPTESGSKKILIGAAALLLIATGLYVAWARFEGKANAPSVGPTVSTPQSEPQSTVQPAARPAAPAPLSPPSAGAHTASDPSAVATANNNQQPLEKGLTHAPKGATKQPGPTDSSSEKPESVARAAEQPIIVKSRSAFSDQKKSATSDSPAPSIIGIAPAGSGGTLSNLIPSDVDSPRPVLQTVNISQGVSQGLLVRKVQPIYPANALHMKVEGPVQLLATIGKTGNITAVKVLSGEPILAKAALDAVKQWKYRPYYLNGDPVEIQTQVTINFKLPR